MKVGWPGKLEKTDDYRFKIPKSYKPGMQVPGFIYADDKLLQLILQDKSPEQVANVACLPGIVRASMAMPDMHWGYGFCVTKDANILTNFGFYKPIKDFEKDWLNQNLKNIDLSLKKVDQTSILKFIKLRPKEVFRVITKGGKEIKATGDHPLFTPLGMKPIKEISEGEKTAIYPFEGVSFEAPSSKTIIAEENVKRTLLKLGRKPNTPRFEIVLQKLSQRKFLPLTYSHPKIPYLLKIMGFIFGDGTMNFIGKRGDGILSFAGKAQDLEEARKDLTSIGYTPSPIHLQKTKDPRGSSKYYNCYSFCVNASSLLVLLESLGVPRGTKVRQAYKVPKWIFKAPLWQKRLFLASLFGCELRRPHRRLGRRGYFNAPSFPMAKREELLQNGRDFLKDIAKLLKEFGVKTLYIDKRKRHVNTKGEISWALELIISPKPENLLNLWGKIGFEYSSERSFNANVAVQYLKFRQKILREKEEAIKISIPQLLKSGLSYQKIAFQLAGNPLTERFIVDVCYRLNKGEKIIPRIPAKFPLFNDYLKEVTEGLGHSGMVWDEIEKIERISYQDFVYDFTVSHSDHNFIANNFVVSNCIGGVAAFRLEDGIISPGGVGYDINCGIRMVKTNLFKDEVKDKLKALVEGLFYQIPAGVGVGGKIKLSPREENEVMTKGSAWAVSHGYGWEEDLEATEDGGVMSGADPGKVSQRAKQRGAGQLGTLGAGNHFLEIQFVEEIFDEEIAAVFGLKRGQAVFMIHCGSRGFGHQICDDYLHRMMGAVNKYGISLPDRQLACAPVLSAEGQDYLAAMACAANYAWANRQCIMHWCRQVFKKVFRRSARDLGLELIYDVCHNIAKIEEHVVDGKKLKLCVHRKGATRAFGPNHPLLPEKYRRIGQPVIIPGDMGRASYLLVGTEGAMKETFGSTVHGAGRVMSRKEATRKIRVADLDRELSSRGIMVRAKSRRILAEEAPEAYKNVNDVVHVVHQLGISKKIAKMKPMGVIKG